MKQKHNKPNRFVKAKTFEFHSDGLYFIGKEAHCHVNEYGDRKSFPATIKDIGLDYVEHPSVPIKLVKAFLECYYTDPNFKEYCDKKFEKRDDIS